MQRGSSFHLSRKFWFWTACVTLSSLNHLAYFGLETLVCNTAICVYEVYVGPPEIEVVLLLKMSPLYSVS